MRIELSGKAFGPHQVLGPVTLELAPGRRLAVLGPSGIGKSTLLRIVTGLDDAADLHRQGDTRLAVVFQEPTLLPWRDALSNLTLVTGAPDAVARDWLGAVGLAGLESHFPRQLSLGQQRRLALARAFAAGPDVLVMDEPFASLDPETRDRMLTLTDRLLERSGAGLLLVTHDQTEAEALSATKLRLDGQPAVLSPEKQEG
ncbi:ATP-binding cassette domain-containing protein [Paracoccus sp. S1E-3]|uniref:ATP-binding cassette domain-containing protein n=1 Tax=Paracoccus sp. S1E-3 TaxID=2756130 RepID=UPI0015EECD26|nr:ATP-binding cassette domain-containing protein [Paracoccus sp. S1E-3]MBA4491112.1 ABC transporter ATP-binding protein [Paracoccus sp. S1E-3]